MNAQHRGRMTGFHLFARLADLMETARRRSRDRAALASVDDFTLSDLGLSRATLAYELNKPFWRG